MASPLFDPHGLRATAARFDAAAERARVWAIGVHVAPEAWQGLAAVAFDHEIQAVARGWQRCAERCEQAAALIRAHAATAENRLDAAATLIGRVERMIGIER